MKELLKDITIRKNYILKQIVNQSQSFLYQTGWINSFKQKKPIDIQGQPVPWWTISVRMFLENRLQSDFRIFEYGSGNSTLYLAPKVEKIVSVEHDRSWYDAIHKNMPSNVELLFSEKDYAQTITQANDTFDIIIIDGLERVACCRACVTHLSERGVVLLDDSYREEYIEGVQFLQEQGFRQLPFYGLSPGLIYTSCTSIFYKPTNNCLGI